uniref:Pre-rRNA-processing protein TSR1 homolog n=1 Tax=Parascaris equorum TaxID=6256 RepID=A0A914SD89_PAREQ
MKQIDVITDPHPLNENKKRQATGDMEEMIRTVLKPDPVKQASLQSEVVPDPMDAEQTWPHQFELPKDVFESKKIIKKVPAGTSAYQAAWILDDEDEGADDENESSEDEEENENMVENAVEEEESEAEEDHIETMTVTSEMDTLESGEDKEIDMSEVEKYRKERENAQFPDEIDTPVDIPARIRFQKYRGLKSFRTSPWDPSENLPITYARIFKFADYRHSKKVALASVDELNDEGAVAHGAYVTVYIASVPSRLIGVLFCFCSPLVTLARMERFMPSDGSFVASVFAPIMFPPASVLVFREDANGRQHVVASGGVLDVNPDRIVLKRVVLSGHPFKILKRHAVVRYMFFNREDIDWFKPVELYTPRGRRGHIREAI